ncbi:hypothetical protein ACQRET_29680 [Streptomyces koyangensis]|uniref:hypothetical protein n=1 Tax=Streptomyces TaxID=1883 RepID=UPI000C6E39FB|nr:hypothetical protein [Streptomyces sp. EAG2]PKR44120.1 hypothetical protein CWE27_16410 [Streptomyces sp. EAG2]
MATRDQQTSAPSAAVNSLRSALTDAGLALPSLAVDTTSPHLGLVELGRVDVAAQLAEALRNGGRA